MTVWLIRALILSLGFGQLLRFEFAGVPMLVPDLLLVLILAVNFPLLKKIRLPLSLRLFGLGLLFGWLRALTLYPFASLLLPALYTLRLVAYLGFFSLLALLPPFELKKYFLLSAFLTITLGILQYILLPDMRLFQHLGWDDHLNRLTLPHFDPTFTGASLAIYLLLFLSHSRVVLLASLALVLTYSRSIWLSMLVTLSSFLSFKTLLSFGFAAILVIAIFLPKRFGEGNNLLRTYSISSRFEADVNIVKLVKGDLVIGRGFNTLVLETRPGAFPNHANGPNNSYLYLLATTGILGLVGWGIFLMELYRHSPYPSIILFVAIASLFNNVMFYPFTMLLMLMSVRVPSANAE